MAPKTLISIGDFIDLYYKLRQKGLLVLLNSLRVNPKSRITSKWNQTEFSGSDFWIITQVRARRNEKSTGDPTLPYEDYVFQKYFRNEVGLRMLSVGCGSAGHERRFAKYANFSLIEGIDLAAKQITEATEEAAKSNMTNVKYHVGDFKTYGFQAGVYDLILFNESLHHFNNIDQFLNNYVKPLLKPEGILIAFEFAGPSRLQWTKAQLDFSNQLLKGLPVKYKYRYNSSAIKKKVYRPGWLRMLLVDPSESVDSQAILPSLHKYFETLEEKQVGSNILHLLLKDIAHNFLDNSEETNRILQYLFDQEDEFIRLNEHSDNFFGVYKKV
jgi:ubiquinone/menaquinone biosynthesis C-methylase UbiE